MNKQRFCNWVPNRGQVTILKTQNDQSFVNEASMLLTNAMRYEQNTAFETGYRKEESLHQMEKLNMNKLRQFTTPRTLIECGTSHRFGVFGLTLNVPSFA